MINYLMPFLNLNNKCKIIIVLMVNICFLERILQK